MGRVYTRRLGFARVMNANAFIPLFTVLDETWVVRDVVMANLSAARVNAYAQLIADIGGVGITIARAEGLPGGQTLHQECRIALHQGDVVSAQSDSPDYSVIVTGYVFV